MFLEATVISLSAICQPYSNAVVVDLNNHVWIACKNGEVVNVGVAAGGRRYCPEDGSNCRTPIGTFPITRKYGYNKRSIKYPLECINKKKCGAKMYWFMRFGPISGEGIHGNDETQRTPFEKLKNVSHGCVRTRIEQARWLNQQFVTEQTKIVVLPYKK